MRIYLVVFLFMAFYPAFGQDTLVLKNGNVKEYLESIVYNDSTTSRLPEILTVDGIVEGQTGGTCGTFCMGGTMKIRLLNPLNNYPYGYAYVATGCVSEIHIGDKIHATVSKLRKTDTECYYHGFIQAVNSHGVPFYKLLGYKVN